MKSPLQERTRTGDSAPRVNPRGRHIRYSPGGVSPDRQPPSDSPQQSAPDRRPLGLKKNGAGDGSRTRDLNLGKVALYQLSYSRVFFYFSGKDRIKNSTITVVAVKGLLIRDVTRDVTLISVTGCTTHMRWRRR